MDFQVIMISVDKVCHFYIFCWETFKVFDANAVTVSNFEGVTAAQRIQA